MWKAFLITSYQGYKTSTWSLSAKFLHSVVVFPFPFSIFGFPDGSVVRSLTASAGDTGDAGSIPRLGRSPGEGNGNPFQYSYLGNPVDRGAWRGYSPKGHKDPDTHEWLSTQHFLLFGNESPSPAHTQRREIKLHLLQWGFPSYITWYSSIRKWGFSSYITWYSSVRKVCPFSLPLKCFPVIHVFQYELESFLKNCLCLAAPVLVVAWKLLAVACGI